MDPRTVSAYDASAATLAARYAAADVSSFHRLLMAHLPPGGRMLEIGCGSGRDAVFLASSVFRVVATDASAAMLAAFRTSNHADLIVTEYPDSRLIHQPVVQVAQAAVPLPADHALLADRFDAVVAMAVVMHIPDADLFEFAYQVRQLLQPGGTVILSASEGRSLDADSRDNQGRLFRERPAGELALLFERLGFRLVLREENTDGLGRDNLRWTTLVLRLEATKGVRPVDQIEAIINRDRKTATYKLALLQALCDIAQKAPQHAQWHGRDAVSVPMGLVAERWLYAYWPLLDAGISQLRGRGQVAFKTSMGSLAEEFRSVGGLNAFHSAYLRNELTAQQKSIVDTAINTISKTIIAGPVKYAGGSLEGDDPFFSFDGRRTARGRCFSTQGAVRSLGRIHFRAEVWRELCLVGHWIGEAILLRWAELTHEITGHAVSVATVLEKLLLHPETERDVSMVRKLYATMGNLECVWTGVALRPTGADGNSLAVDHVIPFSLWHNNELWNLLPTAARVNSKKKDKIITRDALRSAEERVIHYWKEVRRLEPNRFDAEVGRTLLGRNAPEPQWERPVFAALLDATERVAIQRGVPRWDASIAATASKRSSQSGTQECRKGSAGVTPSTQTGGQAVMDSRKS
jgi:SAM-dependent methyltransferase